MEARTLEISGFSYVLESRFLLEHSGRTNLIRVCWWYFSFNTYLYISPKMTSKFCNSSKNWHLSVQTCNSWTNSGTIKNVRHPRIFLLFKISPNIWSPVEKSNVHLLHIKWETKFRIDITIWCYNSPTYKTSLPLAPSKEVNTSHEPPE